MYLVNKFKTEDFIIYDIFYNNDGSKEILLRLLNDHKCVNVLIPPLIKSYSVKQNYVFKFCYLWKRPDGSVREFLSYHLIYNRNEHRNYVVGDVNKFGHELIKIYQRKFLISESKVCDYVGINLNF